MSFEICVMSLGGSWDPGLPIAASRAGEIGLLDLTYLSETSRAIGAVERLKRLGGASLGCLVHGRLGELECAVQELMGDCELVILEPVADWDAEHVIQSWRQTAKRVGVVAISMEEARAAASADFIVAKGNEAGGRVGEETTYVLLQHLIRELELPIFAWGGIGRNTAVACRVAGAAGVVIDWQFALLRESPVTGALRRRLRKLDGSETLTVQVSGDSCWRVLFQPGMSAPAKLQEQFEKLTAVDEAQCQTMERAIEHLLQKAGIDELLVPLGQDAVLAREWADQAPSVARALTSLREHMDTHVVKLADFRPLREGSPLAQAHGTRFPVVQGPMTRVSDVPEFCFEVERGGGLPFIALAMMRGTSVRSILEETEKLMEKRPWGVGILGFVSRELYREQMDVVGEIRPPFVIISGGRPDQAAALEAKGISTYLHAPSPSMLDMFLKEGVRQFIFEGRECGGHVGPRTSFVLWESMIQVLLESDLEASERQKIHVLFAGGIHDELSGAMVSALSLPLVERGIKVGVLMGTAYLFTHEAVATGAIIERFQQVARETNATVLAETGPGHAIRCVPTRFYDAFKEEKARLKQSGMDDEQVREVLDRHNIGRLRIASKGIRRAAEQSPGKPTHELVDEQTQLQEGVYMIGQIAALQRDALTITELHERVCNGAGDILAQVANESATRIVMPSPQPPPPADVAIIGMTCLLPGATNLEQYWDNILNAHDAIGEVPPDRFDYHGWFDPDRNARDKIYSKWGGFIDDIPFDPLKYGIPPASLKSIEPMQLIALELVERALRDAGYLESNPHKERTGLILGVGGGVAELGSNYAVRSTLPRFFKETKAAILDELPEWTEDSFAGILLNVVTGRASNRFDFGGVNFIVDAACASSLAALYLACKELTSGTCDMMITGGCDTTQNPFGYLCFAKTGALSPSGRSRTFDASADGIVISEGHVAIVLKRLADAERDGDRIYAVIKGVAGGSDGRSKGLTAPRESGQIRTLERTYAQARYSPATVSLFEAHGTGTAVGDRTECNALGSLLTRHQAPSRSVAVGSVKSMIGHTKCAAGIAGLMKTAMALHHRVLPPTLHVTQPSPEAGLDEGPLYVNSELRPWIRGKHPRRASVSAFGFGGTNFHAALEEYQGDARPDSTQLCHRALAAELFVFRGESTQAIVASARSFSTQITTALDNGADLDLADLAYTWHLRNEHARGALQAAVVAQTVADLLGKLSSIERAVSGAEDLPQIYFESTPLGADASVAFVFPGQGSQFPNMMRDLAIEFPELANCYTIADRVLSDAYAAPLHTRIFPPPAFSADERNAAFEALKATEVAQPALGVSAVGMMRLLQQFGVTPTMVAGHSYGELVALHAAGVIDEETLYEISLQRGMAMAGVAQENGAGDLGQMIAAAVDGSQAEEIVQGLEECWIANLNAPRQTIISGTHKGIEQARKQLDAAGIAHVSLPVACAFHSPIMAPACRKFEDVLSNTVFTSPKLPVYSNVTAQRYGDDPEQQRELLVQQLVSRVRFQELIESMYEDGARIFVEAGPNRVLSKLVDQILGDRAHVAIATNTDNSNDVVEFMVALAQLIAHGIAPSCERLYQGRKLKELDLRKLARQAKEALPAHTWMLNGGYIRPVNAPPRTNTPKFYLAENGEAAKPQTPATPPVSTKVELPATGDARQQSFARFQETMRRFLETQQAVMESYLGSAGSHFPDRAAIPEPFPPQASRQEPSIDKSVSAQETMQAADLPTESAAERPEGASEVGALAAPTANAAPALDLAQTLTELIAERTGYPPEMLDPDANLEADLGIDSIKRVEIIAAFRREVLPQMQEPTPEFMDRMSAVRTMNHILQVMGDFIAELNHRVVDQAENPPGEKAGVVPSKQQVFSPQEQSLCPRCVVETFAAPLDENAEWRAEPGVVVLTDDGNGLAQALVALIAAKGGSALVLSIDDLSTPATAAAAIEKARKQHTHIAGLIHLLPLRAAACFPDIDSETWETYAKPEINGLLYLMQALTPELEAGNGPITLLSATLGGGDFDDGADEECRHPWRGGIAGLTKVAAREWPQARFRVADFEETPQPEALLQEMAQSDFVEVGYRASGRLALMPVRAELSLSETTNPATRLEPGDVILITGGARGVTAEIAREIAAHSKATLILIGRSEPPTDEDAATNGIDDPKALRGALVKQMQANGQRPSPRHVEQTLNRLLANREIRDTLLQLQQTGANAEYLSCDVRDTEALSRLISQVEKRFGPICAIMHGAGIIEDRFIGDKTPESFDRVVETKINPILTLLRQLDREQLKLIFLFSSVAGFFGNPGQSDYATANEILNRLARRLRDDSPAKVIAVNWGPWSGAGMVTPEVAKQFSSRGVGLIPLAAGRQAALREILAPQPDVRILLGPGSWTDTIPGSVRRASQRPGLRGQSVQQQADGTVTAQVVLDARRHDYLRDHCIGEHPVLPMALAMELMAETAMLATPDWSVTRVENVRLFNGVIVEAGFREILVRAKPVDRSNDSAHWQVRILDPVNQARPFYETDIHLAAQASQPPRLPELRRSAQPFPLSAPDAYRQWLFHGPTFQGISELKALDAHGIEAIVCPVNPEFETLAAGGEEWLLNPLVLDCAFQMGLLWSRACHDVSALPNSLGKLQCYGLMGTGPMEILLRMAPSASAQSYLADVWFVRDNQLLAKIEGLEGAGNSDLNRLCGRVPDELIRPVLMNA